MWPSPPFKNRGYYFRFLAFESDPYYIATRRKLVSWGDRQTNMCREATKQRIFFSPSYSFAMSISTKSLQHVNAPLGIKKLILKEKKSSCGLIPLVLHSVWGELSFLLLSLDSTSAVPCCRALDQVRVSAGLLSWYLKWMFWAGFRPLSSQPVNSMTLVAWGTFLACSPNVCSVPGEASVAHAGFPHSTSKGSWARRQLGFPSLGSVHKAELTTTLHPQAAEAMNSSCAEVATFPCEAAPVPAHPTVPGQSSPEGLREMLELLLSICTSPKL